MASITDSRIDRVQLHDSRGANGNNTFAGYRYEKRSEVST